MVAGVWKQLGKSCALSILLDVCCASAELWEVLGTRKHCFLVWKDFLPRGSGKAAIWSRASWHDCSSARCACGHAFVRPFQLLLNFRAWISPPAGIVTRRPLVLQLHKRDEALEWAEFLHQPGKKYTDWGKRKTLSWRLLKEVSFFLSKCCSPSCTASCSGPLIVNGHNPVRTACLLLGFSQARLERRSRMRRTASPGGRRASLQCRSTWPSTRLMVSA